MYKGKKSKSARQSSSALNIEKPPAGAHPHRVGTQAKAPGFAGGLFTGNPVSVQFYFSIDNVVMITLPSFEEEVKYLKSKANMFNTVI